MQTIRDIIKPSLKSFVQKLVRLRAFFRDSLRDILGKLPFTYTVTVARLLLFEHLNTEIALSARPFTLFLSAPLSKRELLGLSFFKNSRPQTTGDFIFWFVYHIYNTNPRIDANDTNVGVRVGSLFVAFASISYIGILHSSRLWRSWPIMRYWCRIFYSGKSYAFRNKSPNRRFAGLTNTSTNPPIFFFFL